MKTSPQEKGPAPRGERGGPGGIPNQLNSTAIDDPIQQLLGKLKGVKESGKGWIARCPAHEDGNASLSISEGDDGRVLLKCFAGCSTDDIVAAVGLKMADLFPARPSKPDSNGRPVRTFPTAEAAVAALEKKLGKVSQTWRYRDSNCEPVGMICRWDTATGKEIRPVSRNSKGWIIGAMPKPRPLYRLPDLHKSKRIYVCEGEKCADALALLGFVATTSSGGSQAASATDWTPLSGKDVVILPDNDIPGAKYAADVADILLRLNPAPSIKVLALPGLSDGEDVADLLARCSDDDAHAALKHQIETLADEAEAVKPEAPAPTCAPEILLLSDVQAEPINWLWPGRIARGKLTLLAGDPGLGKSFLTLDIAARVTTGAGWPDDPHKRGEPGGVILLSAEDDPADTIRPRMDAARGDVARVALLQAVKVWNPGTGKHESTPFTLSEDLIHLETAIASVADCKLVIIDPISAYMGGGSGFDSHKNTDVRAILGPLALVAARADVAVLAVTHLRKGDGAALYRAMGSLAFVAAARMAWAVAKDPEEPARRLLLPMKANVAAEPTGLAFHLSPEGDTAVVAWSKDPVEVSADDALAPPARKRGPDADGLDAATTWLRRALSGGPRPASDIIDEARDGEGIAKRTLDRARRELQVRAYRPVVPGPWFWSLQGCQVTPENPTKHKVLGNLGNLAESDEKRGFWGGDEGGNPQGCQVVTALGDDDEWGSV
jgi:hypothetical protein